MFLGQILQNTLTGAAVGFSAVELADGIVAERAGDEQGVEQFFDVDGSKFCSRIADGVGDQELSAIDHRAAGVNDIGDIAVAFVGLGPDQWLRQVANDF